MSQPSSTTPTPSTHLPAVIAPQATRGPSQQLGELPLDELQTIAEEFGLNSREYKEKADLVSAVHERRQLIASLDKAALIDVLHWAGRQPMAGASAEQLAIEVVQIRSMRFLGLSERGLRVLALLRGCEISGDESRDELVDALKSQEGFFAKMRRKTRGWLGKRVEKMMGDETTALPESAAPAQPRPTAADPNKPRPQALKEEIEESGLFSGIANRVKRQADSYVNQKLDEIEARIDRKLDEIDRRLAEWRDKEIANRIRILKITLWASVIVAIVSLIYSYITVEVKQWPSRPQNSPAPSTMRTSLTAPTDTTSATAPATATRTNRSFES